MFADVDGITSLVTIIGLLAMVVWVADQTLGDLRQIWRNSVRQRKPG